MNVKQIVSSAWFLALLVAIPVIIIHRNVFNKYKIDLLQTNSLGDRLLQTYYVDLNNDGKKEKVICFLDTKRKNIAVHYYSGNNSLIDQLNFRMNYYIGLDHLSFGDVDNNGYSEIYAFSIINDSLFLNWFEPFPDKNGLQHSRFITRVGSFGDDQYDISPKELHFIDLNHDGSRDIVFSVTSGYSLTPRNVFLFDVKNDTVISSDYFGYNLTNLRFVDLNNDSTTEIVADVASSGNLKDALGRLHLDNRPWLIVLDSKLKPVFKPVPFINGLQNRIYVLPVQDNNKLMVFHFNLNDTLGTRVLLYSTSGSLLKSKYIPDCDFTPDVFITQTTDKKVRLLAGNYYCLIDTNLTVTGSRKLPVENPFRPILLTRLSKESEVLFLNDRSMRNLKILTENFTKEADYHFNEKVHAVTEWNNLGNGLFTVLSDQNEYHLKFMKNRLNYLKFPYYILIYLVSSGFIFLIQFIQTKRLKEKYELQNQVRDLELKSFQSQMDPHFMFNAFTSMASLLKVGKQDAAYNAFVKFSKIVRINLENSNRITRTLGEELQVVRDFLELNKLRFKEKLDFDIRVSEDVDNNLLVPKMVLQIHIENALKHGLRTKKGKGFISLSVNRSANFLKLVVEDNGVGRQKAAGLEIYSTKKGLKMLEALYTRLNQQNKYKIKQNFVDLTDENGVASGTRVEIRIPVNLKE